MSLDQYNSLMSSMLNQWYTLSKLRAELEERDRRNMRVTRVKLPGESLVYKYTLECVTTHLLGESSENRMRLLKGYSTLYIQVPLATERSKDQGQECKSRQLIKYYVIII